MKLKLLLCALLSTTFAIAQIGGLESYNYQNEVGQMVKVPTSPEVSAFQKFGNTPVNLFTGTPNITIPIYTHAGIEMDLPITLRYDASGIKTNQLPTMVGLGWSLDLGGTISRIVNGQPDDFNWPTTGVYKSWYDSTVRGPLQNYLSNNIRLDNNATFGSPGEANDYLDFLYKVHNYEYEIQPDFYSLNVMGINEMFVLRMDNRTAQPLKNDRIKIQHDGGAMNFATSTIDNFIVTSDNGTKYEFTLKETTKTTRDQVDDPLFGKIKYYNSAWYLTKITSPTEKDIYEFIYEQESSRNTPPPHNLNDITNEVVWPPALPSANVPNFVITETTHYGPPNSLSSTEPRESVYQIKHNGKLIVAINNNDNYGNGPDTAIDDIKIYHKPSGVYVDRIYKKYDFTYSYFNDDVYSPSNPSHHGFVRLKLDAIEVSGKGDVEEQYYFSYYNENEMPPLSSNAQDYLGYYNGAPDGQQLYPFLNDYNIPSFGGYRGHNFNKAKHGLLKRIEYPTKGFTEFTYESDAITTLEFSDDFIVKSTLTHNPSSIPAEDTDQCNLQILGPDITPNVAFGDAFYIRSIDEGNHELTYTKTGNGSSGTLGEIDLKAFIIKVPDQTTTYTWADLFDGNCNFKTSSGAVLIWELSQDWLDDPSDIPLMEGWYRIVLPVHYTEDTKTLTVEGIYTNGITTEVEEEKAGIRIESIRDFTADGEIASIKEYSYAGSQLSNPILHYETPKTFWDDSQGLYVEDQPTLHRLTQPINMGATHVGYYRVRETVKDFNNESNNGSTTYRFETLVGINYLFNQGTYSLKTDSHDGVSNNYSFDAKGGALLSKSISGMKESTEYGTKNQFFYQEGGYLSVYPRYNDRWPVIKNIGGQYVISVDQGDITIAGGNVILTPPACPLNDGNCKKEISRLILQPVKTYGAYGGNAIQSKVEEITSEGDNVVTTYFSYNSDNLISEQYAIDSYSKQRKTKIFYPQDMGLGYGSLVSRNMISNPVRKESYEGTELLSAQQTNYTSGTIPLTESIETQKGLNVETRLEIDEYDNKLNVRQLRQADGLPVTYIWGYNYRFPVALVKNAVYDDIFPHFGVTYSSLQSKRGTELENLLNNFRSWLSSNRKEAEIITYTYNPVIGVASITDESGLETRFEYDDFHRLLYIRDADNNIVKEYGYNTLIEEPNNDDPFPPIVADHVIATSFGSSPIQIEGNVFSVSGGSGSYLFRFQYSIDGGSTWYNIIDPATGSSETTSNHFEMDFNCTPPSTEESFIFKCRIRDADPTNTQTPVYVESLNPLIVLCTQ